VIRVHHRVGRRTWVSTPLWLALIGYVLWATVAIGAALAVAIVVAGMVVILLLSMLARLGLERIRRRRALSKQ
jgi:hypothetical protein